jgi:hypothetical protein
MTCDCGLTYDAMRTGMTFDVVRRMMFTADPRPETWRSKRRPAVLGFWHELKLQLWHYHVDQCGAIAPF